MSDVMFVCPPPPRRTLPVTAILCVGFGWVEVTRDDETIWHGDDDRVTLRRFERKAKADPAYIWRVQFYGPMSGETYERGINGQWALIAHDQGFA